MTKSSMKRALRLAKRFRVGKSVTDIAVREILEGLDTPRSLAVWLLYSSREHRQLVDLEISPDDYLTYEDFRSDYLATELLSKAKFLSLDSDPEQVALSKHVDAERRCKVYNGWFRSLGRHPKYKGDCVQMYNTFVRKVQRIVGPCPEIKEIFELCQWGPGSTTRVTGSDTSHANKFQNDSGITKDLLNMIGSDFIVEFPSWFMHVLTQNDWEFDVGNIVQTVPKNAKTDRVIAIEPGWNQWFQKGIGEYLRKRLLHSCGVDLRDQTLNGERARISSRTGECATIDLKTASSLISCEMVRESMDPEWFSILDKSRSQYGVLDGSVFRWENFSAMGNGFTFPLQSVIFYAAAYSACDLVGASKDSIGVFGDDIVIPVEAVPPFLSFLDFLGLEVNQKKSFFSGVFRESCGSHWFDGVDVKPFYIKERLTTLDSLYRLANAIRRCAHRYGFHTYCCARLFKAWASVIDHIPHSLRFIVSDGFGDVGIIGNFDEARPSVKRADNWVEGYFCPVVSRVGLTREHFGFGLLLAKLSLPIEASQKNSVPLRRLTKLRIHRILVHRWRDLGVWC